MSKVLVVIGTRPEAIKLAPVIKQLGCFPDCFQVCVCVTAQHRDMLDQVLSIFNIVPDIDLNLMQEKQTPTRVAARILFHMEEVLLTHKPDWVLIQGDTTTVLATAIAAHYQRIRIGHVEAGLRTGDRWNPFPEEMNRVVADALSDLHFVPTDLARQNLLCEGIDPACIFITGNTVIDALLNVASSSWKPQSGAPVDMIIQNRQSQNGKRLILVTAHRRENFGKPLETICDALIALSRRDDVRIVYAVHPNPNVKDVVYPRLSANMNIELLPPLDYRELVYLLKHSALVLTDSGGLQEEAPSLGVPVLILRQKTERPEAVVAGTARVVGTDKDQIVGEVTRLLDDPQAYSRMARSVNPYGYGNAAERIVKTWMDTSDETYFKISSANLG